MKHLTILATLILLILAAGVFAAEKPLHNQQASVLPVEPMRLPYPSMTFLKLEPMMEELEIILKEMRVREDKLLKELVAATDEEQADRIIHSIMRLDTDRELALLKVQARFARLSGRFQLEREIKGEILKILNADLALLY